MLSKGKALMQKQYKGAKRAREPDFNSTRFVSSAAFKIFSEILPQESLTDCYYFNYGSLERTKVPIRDFFSSLGIDHFTECNELIYPCLVREFYTNLHIGDSVDSPSLVLRSLVNGTTMTVSSEILFELFGLSMDGFSCSGKAITEESDLNELELSEFLSLKAVIDITDDVFENNDFGINIWLLLVALTKCIMLKVNTQHKLVGVDKNVVYRVLNDDKVDFAAIVTSWMKMKGDSFRSKHYLSRSQKAGLPYGSVLTMIFRRFNVDLSGEASVPVSWGHEITDLSLKAMHYVETYNRGWVLFSYLRKDDRVPKGTRVLTPAERVSPRGLKTLREIQTGSFVRHQKVKGKRKVVVNEEEENDLVARMCSLETMQLEIREDVRALRSEVQGAVQEVHSVRGLLEDFIRYTHPSFPFPSPSSDQAS